MKLDSEKPELKSRTKDLAGRVFQALTVLSFAGYGDNQSGGKAMWTCQCSCGRSVVLRANALTSGNTKSCGCLRFVNKPYKHKAAGTKAHNSWRAMKGRCYDENNIQYKDYGGRGIKMDDCFREDFLSFSLKLETRLMTEGVGLLIVLIMILVTSRETFGGHFLSNKQEIKANLQDVKLGLLELTE